MMPHLSLASPDIDAWVASRLAEAPPLTSAQRDRIAAAFGADQPAPRPDEFARDLHSRAA